MTNQQEITQFLNEWIRWPRMANPAFGTWATPYGFQPQRAQLSSSSPTSCWVSANTVRFR